MNSKLLYGISVFFGTAALLLLIANVSMILSNRSLQAQISNRGGVISQGVNASQLNQSLVQALADTVVKNNNTEIKELLAAQGITIKPVEKADKAEAAEPATKKK